MDVASKTAPLHAPGSIPGPGLLVLEADGSLEDSALRTTEVAGAQVGVCSLRAPQGTGPNEDGALVLPLAGDLGVCAVADGFGGRASGEKAARLALEALRDSLLSRGAPGGAREGVLSGFEAANRRVLDLGVGAATTLLAVELHGGTLRTYNVGDSMLLVVGQRGKIKLRTIPQSPVGYAVESGLLDEDEAMHHEDRHYVSNMVGAPDMRIEMTVALPLDPLDTIVLGTDGVWDNLHPEEVVEIVRAGALDEVLPRLAAAARARMESPQADAPSKPDDCTFVVVRPGRGE